MGVDSSFTWRFAGRGDNEYTKEFVGPVHGGNEYQGLHALVLFSYGSLLQ
jgi:hypothetical protein